MNTSQGVPDPTGFIPEHLKQKYKFCVLENGTLKIPEEGAEDSLVNNMKNCVFNSEPQVVPPQSPINSEVKNKFTANRSKTNEKENNEFNVQIEDDKSSSEDEDKEEEENVPKVEPLDTEVMNGLLDYYRRFNERQMGITVDRDAPYYKETDEPPVGVICDNDIIKEAVIRVGQKQEAGELMKEPTIIEINSDDEEIGDEGWKAVELERQREMQVQIEVEDEGESDLDDPNQYEQFLQQVQHRKEYFNDCVLGANFIEKTLEKKIDENTEKFKPKKWSRRDIVNLVEILSEKKKRRMNLNSTQDDVVDKVDRIQSDYEGFDGDSLFEQLKRGDYVQDNSYELKQMVAENSVQFTTGKIVLSKQEKIYYGGDELLVVYDWLKGMVNLHWVWVFYDKLVDKLFARFRAEKLQYDYRIADNNKWSKLKSNLSQMSWLLTWLPASWRVGVTGKPIYKQLSYRDSEATDWKSKLGDDSGIRTTNRRRRRVKLNEGVEFSLDRYHEDIQEFQTNQNEGSIVIDVEEKEEFITDDEYSDIEEEEKEAEKSESSDSEVPDVIGNFRKMRSMCIEDRPLAGRLYIQQPDGKLVFNHDNDFQ